VEILSVNFRIVSFSYVNDEGDFFETVELSDSDVKNNFGCTYGCGIFTCIKI